MIEILSLLGGAGFRALFGGVLEYLNKRQDHKYELERLDRQTQNEILLAEIRAKHASAEADARLRQVAAEYTGKVELADAEAFGRAFEIANKPTGMTIPDWLSAMVRPGITYVYLGFFIYTRVTHGPFEWGEPDTVLFHSLFGFWFMDRAMRKISGK
jgi:hypothetical protein